MQGTKTTSEFDREVENEEEAYDFGLSVASFHVAVFEGLRAANEEAKGEDNGEEA
jgi:hypothetical protein